MKAKPEGGGGHGCVHVHAGKYASFRASRADASLKDVNVAANLENPPPHGISALFEPDDVAFIRIVRR